MARSLSRRRLLGALALGSALTVACGTAPSPAPPQEVEIEVGPLEPDPEPDADAAASAAGTLSARPLAPTAPAAARPGRQPLGLGGQRDGLLYLPAGYRPDRPAPLVLLLHGAGGDAGGGLDPLLRLADGAGAILLAPDSRGPTWDVVLDWFGPDVAFVDAALARTFERYAVDPGRVAIGGFSDGASYALSLGLTNGDLFTHVLAFSPGFAAPAAQRGRPRLYVSHGTRDDVLPIEQCSRRIVPLARQAGYEVTYQEFDGGHVVPEAIARAAVAWFLAPAS